MVIVKVKQKGFALITVMMILAVLKVIGVTIAATIMGRLTLGLMRTGVFNHDYC